MVSVLLMILKSLIAAAATALLSVGCGRLLFPDSRHGRGFCACAGMCLLFALFEVICVSCTLTCCTFRTAAYLWAAAAVIAGGAGFLISRKAAVIKPEKAVSLSKNEILLLALAAVIILYQLVRLELYMTPSAADDLDYIATSTTSLYTNTLYRYDQASGYAVDARFMPERSMSPWPVFIAVWSLFTGVHPLVLFHVVLPVVFLPLFYAVSYLIFRFFFSGNREKSLFAVLALAVFCEFFAVDQAFSFWWPINESWTGKAIGPSVICPLALYEYLLITAETEAKERCRLFISLFITGIAGCMISNTCAILIPMILFAWGLVTAIRRRSLREIPPLFVCVLPCLLLDALTVLL